ncbi:hypothetical protein [uncultured Methanoregula sp.]|uniref:hypothetical protein n=1 Tax=uncultured Methanoregula sp. TaxID=1005933 RepID=UPI002AAB4BDB|nr:hypothetical protein [uncultured Methanoregula sp.]
MENPSTLLFLIAVLTAGACIAGCITAPVAGPAVQHPATPVPTVAVMDQKTPVSLLFVQESPDATLIQGTDSTYTLTLGTVVPYTMYFSDRPDRVAGFTGMDDFISSFNWSVAPNAAISRPGAKESEDTIIVVLSNPRYNASAKRLTYTVSILGNYQESTLADFAAKADPVLPAALGKVSLFIDSSGTQVICPASHPYKCADGSCTVAGSFCPIENMCPATAPIRCPDGKCSESVSACRI